ncbi:MAG: AMP-binding protein, partial [bacterium]|nr:AMP-binding protein [bacterium]
MEKPIWEPGERRVRDANLIEFIRAVAERHGAPVSDFGSLYSWSINEPAAFWGAVWEFCGVVASQPATEVVRDLNRMPGAQWFVGARLNFAENLLRRRDDHQALVFWNEQGRQRELSYAALYDQVRRLAARLRSWGLEPGDRVAGYLPNLPETVIAMLAT